MEFQVIIVIVTLVSLFATLLFVYINYPPPNITIPHAMTTCPDHWEVTEDGKCIIPSADISGANIGDLATWKMKLYEYEFLDTSSNQIILVHNTLEKWEDVNNNTYTGKIYRDEKKNPIYAYNLPENDLPETAYNRANYDYPIAFDFFSPDWTNHNHSFGSRICQIKKWMNKHNIQWDGVSQYNRCNTFTYDREFTPPSPSTAAPETSGSFQKYLPNKNSNMYGSKADIYMKV